MQHSVASGTVNRITPNFQRQASDEVNDKKLMVLNINIRKTQQRLAEVRVQLDKIYSKMDQCEEKVKNGQELQKQHALKTLKYLFKNKRIYEDYQDKLLKDQITMDVLGKAFFPSIEQLNEDLEIIQEERSNILNFGMEEESIDGSSGMDNKYTLEFQDELINRNYKVNIDEEELDKQLIPFEEDHQRFILNNINKRIIPDYFNTIKVAKRRTTML